MEKIRPINIIYTYNYDNNTKLNNINKNIKSNLISNDQIKITTQVKEISPLSEFLNKASLTYILKADRTFLKSAQITNIYKSYYYEYSFSKIEKIIDLKIPYESLQ
jgi:hypothetical protein